MDQPYNFLGWEELPGTRDGLEVLRVWIDELAQKNIKFQAPNYRFQCSRLRLKGFGAASSVPRCSFASDGIFDRFSAFVFLFPDT
jgi:hypothetical protein